MWTPSCAQSKQCGLAQDEPDDVGFVLDIAIPGAASAGPPASQLARASPAKAPLLARRAGATSPANLPGSSPAASPPVGLEDSACGSGGHKLSPWRPTNPSASAGPGSAATPAGQLAPSRNDDEPSTLVVMAGLRHGLIRHQVLDSASPAGRPGGTALGRGTSESATPQVEHGSEGGQQGSLLRRCGLEATPVPASSEVVFRRQRRRMLDTSPRGGLTAAFGAPRLLWCLGDFCFTPVAQNCLMMLLLGRSPSSCWCYFCL